MSASSWARLAFIASATLMILNEVAGVRILAFTPHQHFGFFDLKIYRDAANAVVHGQNLYAAQFQVSFGFTYPPFAALLFVPLRLLGVRGDEIVVTAANLGLLVLGCRLAIGLVSRRGDRPVVTVSQTTQVWLTGVVALWAEPIISTFGYGQIDLLVAVLVMADLLWLSDTRWGGAAIGLAAAIKLTPLIFLPYLLLSRRASMAARGLGTFIAAIAISFAAVPTDAWDYWTDAVFHTSRVTGTSALASHQRYPGRGPADQSLHGALLRLFAGHANITELWLLACLLIGGSGLWLAVLAARRGDEALGFVLTAVVGLLISPVSWDHHWVIATPGLLLLTCGRSRGVQLAGTAAAVAITFGSSALITLLRNTGARLDVAQMLLGNLYVLIGVAAIAAAGLAELGALRWRAAGRRGRDSNPR